ncbi:protein translocase subunit SecD [Mesorhizobium sp. SB112]|uniref:protein translocase subunit SecD n=1 Tax=Mesorhizobium sp. SB112 TaxID=3151853 RepID=UPI0032636B8C
MLYFSRWKTILIWLVVVVGALFAAPNLLSPLARQSLPDWLPKSPMVLGLDLLGGSHILLSVEREGLIEQRLDAERNQIRTLLRAANIAYSGLSNQDRSVQLRINDPGQVDAAKAALAPLLQPIATGFFGNSTVEELRLETPEPNLFRYTLTNDGIAYRREIAVQQSVDVLSRRVLELGSVNPIIEQRGDGRILVQVPGLPDSQRLKDILGQTGNLTFQMVDDSMPVQQALDTAPPAGSSIVSTADDPPTLYLVKDRVWVSGANLVDAQPTYSGPSPAVAFRFDAEGTAAFGQMTTENVGRQFVMMLDGAVISAPNIREPIVAGTGQVAGDLDAESANDLAVLLRAGALPADLTIVEERSVAPSLGSAAKDSSYLAALIAGALVVAFMILSYGWLGVIANLALVANVVLIIAALSFLGSPLTLPGIAGIILTMGMAVDSNVIIYERIKEERRLGKSLVQSIDAGFSRAVSTVFDANITTFIAAAILFYLGSGAVRGFAVTVALGIVTTLFTAFTLTRWLVSVWLRKTRPTEMPHGIMKLVPEDTRIPFMGLRKYAFTLSAILSIGTAVLFLTKDLNYGIDFSGGSIIEMQANAENADVNDVSERVSELNLGEVELQPLSQKVLQVRIAAQQGGDNAEQSAVDKLRLEFGQEYDFQRVEIVGPTVSNELARSAASGILAALAAMLLYVWMRFKWQFGLGAVFTTLHDVIVMVGFYVLTGIEFNLTSIAAIMVIVGYSINDTIVVYDRVRENLRLHPRMPIRQLLNMSMNQTLSRTLLTGITTLLALGALYVFGGSLISPFAFAMIFGVLFATYSSIFVAGPLLILFKLRPDGTDIGRAAPKFAPSVGS